MMPMIRRTEMATQKLEPGQYSIPEYIRVDGDRRG
jgi:hypothetical protein